MHSPDLTRRYRIITFNKKDFRYQDLKSFGLQALTPKEFLREIGELS